MTFALPAKPPRPSSRPIRPEIAKLKADALVVSDPHAVAWTFNIRGADVSHTPLPLSFAIIPREGRPSLFIDGRKLSNDVRHRLEEIADVRAPSDFVARAFRARQSRQDRAARPGDRRRRAGADRDRRRRQGQQGPRSDRAAQGGEECRSRSKARAKRTGATARRWCASSPGSTVKRPKENSPRSAPWRRSKPSAARPIFCATCRSRPSPAPGRTARSCTIASPARPTAPSRPAICS